MLDGPQWNQYSSLAAGRSIDKDAVVTDQPTSSDGDAPDEARTFIPVGKDYFSLSDEQKRALIRQWLQGIRGQIRKPDTPADTDAPSDAPGSSEDGA